MSAPQTPDRTQTELGNLSEVLEAAGIYVAVESRDGNLILSGEVDSAEMRVAALDLGTTVAGRLGLTIEDAIEVLDLEYDASMSPSSEYHIDTPVTDTSTIFDVGSTYSEQAAEEGLPFFPPTDPVLGNRSLTGNDVEVIGGYQPTSMDDEEISEPNERGDDEITEDVRRELREDALTTDLEVQTHTRNRIVYLTGEVPTMDDAENAESVAARVQGVREVREDLTVRDLMTDHNR